MPDHAPTPSPSPLDQLITRPDEPLPTAQDPKSPRGEPADPKLIAPGGQGTDPKAGDLDYTA